MLFAVDCFWQITHVSALIISDVLFQKQVQVFHQGFETRENRCGLMLLWFSIV